MKNLLFFLMIFVSTKTFAANDTLVADIFMKREGVYRAFSVDGFVVLDSKKKPIDYLDDKRKKFDTKMTVISYTIR